MNCSAEKRNHTKGTQISQKKEIRSSDFKMSVLFFQADLLKIAKRASRSSTRGTEKSDRFSQPLSTRRMSLYFGLHNTLKNFSGQRPYGFEPAVNVRRATRFEVEAMKASLWADKYRPSEVAELTTEAFIRNHQLIGNHSLQNVIN